MHGTRSGGNKWWPIGIKFLPSFWPFLTIYAAKQQARGVRCHTLPSKMALRGFSGLCLWAMFINEKDGDDASKVNTFQAFLCPDWPRQSAWAVLETTNRLDWTSFLLLLKPLCVDFGSSTPIKMLRKVAQNSAVASSLTRRLIRLLTIGNVTAMSALKSMFQLQSCSKSTLCYDIKVVNGGYLRTNYDQFTCQWRVKS